VRVDTFLDRSALAHPGKTALVFGQRRLTYAEIAHAADRLAAALASMGVRRGDRVAIYLENSPEAVIAVFGALKADAVFVMINPTTKPEKLVAIMNDCSAVALITDARRLPITAAARAGVRSVLGSIVAGIPADVVATGVGRLEAIFADGSLPVPERRAIDLDLAALIYTSGSSGRPKGVMLSHRNMVTAATSITTYLENRPDDVILNVLPLSFDYGLYQLLLTVMVGGTLVLEKGFAFPGKVVQLLESEGVTGLPGVPTLFGVLLGLRGLEARELPALRYLSNTGAALSVTTIAGLRETFPAARIYSMYGLTECKRCTWLPPEDLDRKPDSVGIAIPNTEMWIVDENDCKVGPGVVGQLVIRGGTVMRGYWNKPEATARALRPGPLPGEQVFYTGDLVRMDEEGYVYFVGRMDDIIKSRGEKVPPKEVEAALMNIAGVKEAAVIGVPDETLGQAVKAYVVFENGFTIPEREIQKECQRRLEGFMVPKHVVIVPSLPKTDTGKIRKLGLN
jgi:amino acid adenylation domain-containing protein